MGVPALLRWPVGTLHGALRVLHASWWNFMPHAGAVPAHMAATKCWPLSKPAPGLPRQLSGWQTL